jgi:hypothetical protein
MGRLALVLLAVAATVFLVACGRGAKNAGPAAVRLYLVGDGELWVVDTGTDRVHHLLLPQLSPGDPPYRIVRRGRRFVLWGFDTYVTGPRFRDLRRLARGSWFFIPSAAPDRVWITFLDAKLPSRARHLGAVREVAAAGRITVPDARPPGGQWPQAATNAGLLFFRRGRFELWDPRRRVVLRTFPPSRIGYPGPAYGDLLASCTGRCGALRLTDVRTGAARRVRAPAGTTFEITAAAFAPDGNTLGIPAGGRLALVDVHRGTIRLVEGSRVRPPYYYVAWAASGHDVFLTGGDRRRTIVEYRVGDKRAHPLPVRVGRFYGMAAL